MNTKNQNEEEELKQNQAANEEAEAQAEKTQNKEESNEELTNEQKLEKELEAANKTIEEQKDKYLRLSAEFDNYRKRTMKEKAELMEEKRPSVPSFRFWMTWNVLCKTRKSRKTFKPYAKASN